MVDKEESIEMDTVNCISLYGRQGRKYRNGHSKLYITIWQIGKKVQKWTL